MCETDTGRDLLCCLPFLLGQKRKKTLKETQKSKCSTRDGKTYVTIAPPDPHVPDLLIKPVTNLRIMWK